MRIMRSKGKILGKMKIRISRGKENGCKGGRHVPAVFSTTIIVFVLALVALVFFLGAVRLGIALVEGLVAGVVGSSERVSVLVKD